MIPTSSLTENDVLLGRGKGVHRHRGNIRYRELVRSLSEGYVAGRTAIEREMIARQVIASVEGYGGRFLEPKAIQGDKRGQQQVWIPASYPIARKKVKQALRDMVKTNRTTEKTDREEKEGKPEHRYDRRGSWTPIPLNQTEMESATHFPGPIHAAAADAEVSQQPTLILGALSSTSRTPFHISLLSRFGPTSTLATIEPSLGTSLPLYGAFREPYQLGGTGNSQSSNCFGGIEGIGRLPNESRKDLTRRPTRQGLADALRRYVVSMQERGPPSPLPFTDHGDFEQIDAGSLGPNEL